MKRLLKLHHHRHTGKLLHHRHTSYPALIALVIVAGFLVFMTGRVANADDIAVSARVPAPIPSGAPVFTAPTEGSVVSNPAVDFAGTCPVITPAVIIELYDGPTLLGSGQCAGNGTFAVTATIASGLRSIVASVVTITEDHGDSSAPLHVTYQPPVTPSSPTKPSVPKPGKTPPSPSAPPLAIIPDKSFITFAIGKPTAWKGHIEGGTAPYKVTVGWGDDEITKKDSVTSDLQSFTHIYIRSRIYTLTISVTDASGQRLTRQYAAMTLGVPANDPGLANNIVTALDNIPNDLTATVLVMYAALAALLAILWRYEFLYYRNAVAIPLRYGWNDRSYHRFSSRSKKL